MRLFYSNHLTIFLDHVVLADLFEVVHHFQIVIAQIEILIQIDVAQVVDVDLEGVDECEACGEKQPVRRLIGTGGAVIFKGSGFYQTDYRSKSYKEAAKAESGEGKKTDGDASKKPAESKTTRNESTAESKSSASTKKSD